MSVSTGLDVSVPGRLEEVADGVFAYVQPDGSWMINNTGFLVARDGVTAVDACSTERRTRAFFGIVASVAGARTIVPGHGPVTGPEVIDDVLGYLRFVRHTAEQGRAAGLSPWRRRGA